MATYDNRTVPVQIGGTLPWGTGGANMFQGLNGDPNQVLAALGSNYANAYNSSLAMNQQNYNNILSGYQNLTNYQDAAQQYVIGGYNDLQNDVMGGIKDIGSSQRTAINDAAQQQFGNVQQGLINSGLGNTTVQASARRGIESDRVKSQNNLENQIAQTKAGYQTQLGLANLSYQGQAVAQNAALGQNQLAWMNTVNAAYPDAGAYAAIAQQAGVAQQAALNRQMYMKALDEARKSGVAALQQSINGSGGGILPPMDGGTNHSAINWANGLDNSAAGAYGGYGTSSYGGGVLSTPNYYGAGSVSSTPNYYGTGSVADTAVNTGYGALGGAYNGAFEYDGSGEFMDDGSYYEPYSGGAFEGGYDAYEDY